MIKVMSTNTFEELARSASYEDRVRKASRWLAEFDEFLDPLWGYLIERDRDIEIAREQMRKAFKK